MLPARQLGEHQQTPPVALVQKIWTLGVVAGAHGGAVQFLLQNAGILPLQAFRCGVADVRVALVSVQTPQEGLFSVEVKAIRPELCGAEAKRHLFAIDGLSGCVQKLCHGMMQNRVLGIPRLCVRDGKLHLPGFCRLCGLLCQQGAVCGLQPDADRHGCGCKLCRPLHHGIMQGGRVDEQIRQAAFCRSFQPDLPVQPAVGQVKGGGCLIQTVVHHQLVPLLVQDVAAGFVGDAAGVQIVGHGLHTAGHSTVPLAELDLACLVEHQCAAAAGGIHTDSHAPQGAARVGGFDVLLACLLYTSPSPRDS